MAEADRWKAVAYDKMIATLQGAKVNEYCAFMVGARVKILVFDNNDKADEFEKLMRGANGSSNS